MNDPRDIARTRPVLHARDVSATLEIGGSPVRVLDGISLQVQAGEIVDVVGPSGSGKSTLLRAIARLLPGASGELELDGVAPEGPQQWRRMVALVPQKPALVSGSVRDNLRLPWGLKVAEDHEGPPDGELRAALDAAGLIAVDLERPASKLSVGQLARVGFVRTVLTRPVVLLLDEVDAALDDDSSALLSTMTRGFVESGERRCVVRVRHRGSDGLAARRLRLESGHLEEVAV